MKTCPNCKTQLDDSALFCTTCGVQFGNAQPQGAVPPQQNAVPPQQNAIPPQQGAIPPQGAYAAAPGYDPYDHRLNLIPRIFQTTRFLPCFVTLWILSASLLPSSQLTHQSTQCSM